MAHDASKVVLGATRSTYKHVENMNGSIAAGTLVRLKSDGTLSVASADGSMLGVSLGKDLGERGRTAIVKKGSDVPVLLTAAFTPTIGAKVTFSDTTGLAASSGTASNATYTALKTGIAEDGSEVNIALIDMSGGL
jgi:hypothetical protein